MKITINRTILRALSGGCIAALACNGDNKTETSAATITSTNPGTASEGTNSGSTSETTNTASGTTDALTGTTDAPTGTTGTTTGTTDAPTSTDGTATGTTTSTTTSMTSSTTGEPGGVCGWDPDNSYYECGFEGEDPGGQYPIVCPDGLVDGDPCGRVSGSGCCAANGDLWFCAVDGMGTFLAYTDCR